MSARTDSGKTYKAIIQWLRAQIVCEAKNANFALINYDRKTTRTYIKKQVAAGWIVTILLSFKCYIFYFGGKNNEKEN